MKWQYLLNRSMTVRMTDLPPMRGKASMKLSPTFDHTMVGTGSGRSNPAGCRCSDLWRWHVAQALT